MLFLASFTTYFFRAINLLRLSIKLIDSWGLRSKICKILWQVRNGLEFKLKARTSFEHRWQMRFQHLYSNLIAKAQSVHLKVNFKDIICGANGANLQDSCASLHCKRFHFHRYQTPCSLLPARWKVTVTLILGDWPLQKQTITFRPLTYSSKNSYIITKHTTLPIRVRY